MGELKSLNKQEMLGYKDLSTDMVKVGASLETYE